MDQDKFPWSTDFSIELRRSLKSETDLDALKAAKNTPKKSKDIARIEKKKRTVHSCFSSTTQKQKIKEYNDDFEKELELTISKAAAMLVSAGLLLPQPAQAQPSIMQRVDLPGRSTSKLNPFIDLPIQLSNPIQSLKNLRANRLRLKKRFMLKPIQKKPGLPSILEVEEPDEYDEPWNI